MKKLLFVLPLLFVTLAHAQETESWEQRFQATLAQNPVAWSTITSKPSLPTTVVKTANQTKINNTLTNVDDLLFTVNNTNNYLIEFSVFFASNVTTNGLKLGVTYPTATIATYKCEIPLAADAAAGMWHGWGTSSGDAVTATGVQAANTTYLAYVKMQITPSTNGTVQLQFASETANLTTIFYKSYGTMTTY